MKKKLTMLLIAAACVATAAAGNFKIGPKVGLNINKFGVDPSVLASDNRCGFNAGVNAQFTVPVIGVGADVSAMFSRRYYNMGDETAPYSYISVPVHVMYKLSLPAVSRIVAPFVVTGPDFAFAISKDIVSDIKQKNCNVSWDFGLGLELIKHLQVSACYSLGMNKALTNLAGINGANIDGNINGWTVSAAWLF